MEIQKIFSEIDTDEKIYSVLLNEEELALFSEIQKEFSSKAQKARRAKFDTSIAKEMYGGTEGSTNDPNQLKRVGRAKAKQGTIRRIKTENGAGSRLSYDTGRESLSNGTKNVFLDASKGKKSALNEVRWRAIHYHANEPTNSKKFESADKLLNKLDAIEKKAGRVAKLKTAGKVGLGIAGAAGIGYGIKRAVDKKKKDNK